MPSKDQEKMHKIMKKFKYGVVVFSFIFLFFGVAKITLGLSVSDLPIPTQIPDLEEQIDVTVNPEFPRPGDQVKITLDAFGTDLNNATITWTVDGKVAEQGKGQISLTFTAGNAGRQSNIKVTVQPVNSRLVTKSFVITPQSVDVVWEAQTYTPPFYKGKAMYTPQEKLVFVAMPNFIQGNSIVGPDTVTYKWKEDLTVEGNRSGYGVQRFDYRGGILMRPVDIGVEVSTQNGLGAENHVILGPTSPEVTLYENSPLYGILFNKEISRNFEFGSAEERSIAAFPYFFGATDRNDPDLSYKWTINGNAINVPKDQTDMTFRNTENLEGKSIIGIVVNNISNFLEEAKSAMIIDFKRPGKSSLFSL